MRNPIEDILAKVREATIAAVLERMRRPRLVTMGICGMCRRRATLPLHGWKICPSCTFIFEVAAAAFLCLCCGVGIALLI